MTKCQLGFSTLFAALAFAGCVATPEPVFQAIALEAKAPALRTKVDLARGMRWEMRWGSVEAYDIASGQLIRAVPLPGAVLAGAKEAGLPDMVLDRLGALIVSSNITTRLWRVSPARFEVEVLDIETEGDAGRDFGFTGLARGPSDREIYAASEPMQTVWRVDLTSGKASKMPVRVGQR
jgi:hypothetical protein